MQEAITIYETHAADMAARYDSMDSADLLAPVIDLLPPPPATVLDIGAGSGRDAAWFLDRGHPVTVAEPVAAFRKILAARAPAARIIDARLPLLEGVDGRFDLILCCAVWHHLPPAARRSAMGRIAGLLVPGGRFVLSLRHGPMPAGQPIHPLDPPTEARRARACGMALVRRREAAGHGAHDAAPALGWTWLVLERETSG